MVAVRSRPQVRAYLERKLNDELPSSELEGMTVAYRLFGLLPDTLDLRALLLSLYTEQVAGYFDPDSNTLYVVAGSDPALLRMTLAHELVHALQGQYMPLDSILETKGANDRRMAAQAVFEGQATLASLRAMMPDQDVAAIPDFWQMYRQQLKRQHTQMPVFSGAPLIIRESLIFPYLEGARFVQRFLRDHRDTVPYGRRLPVSTEQILHPDRYSVGDVPTDIALVDTLDLVFTDGLGEFETRVLFTALTGSESMGRAGALGWDGDRYAVFRAADDYALVWWSVWDSDRAADRVGTLLKRHWHTARSGSRTFSIERLELSGMPAVRVIDAPRHWAGWRAPSRAAVRQPPGGTESP